ncbi:MAG TPA: SUMF1/EgtB/PvdO family nonheme iron enzyme [Anaerolineales bacterium]|nr:SUMF1/EgtB/PvdO family nonheme iron enzyme [Anaerolineales bacterium]
MKVTILRANVVLILSLFLSACSGGEPSEITDSRGVEMVLVLEGEFTMGSDIGPFNEQPVRQVFLDTYYIDKFEVTNEQYKVCVEEGVCERPTDTTNFNNSEYAQHPVVWVDWDMARTYCEWRGARLPTESEWEKAARGTDGRTYPWGEEIDSTYANYGGKTKDTTSVGEYPKGVSPYGAYDMAGNVWEWVDGWFDAYPGNEGHHQTEYGTTYRNVRGGGFPVINFFLRSSFRGMRIPSSPANDFGFRCADSEVTGQE